MAKEERAKPETKSEFLRKVLGKAPDLDYQQVNRRWAKAGHAGEISNALYYQVRAKLGIKSVWGWFPSTATSSCKCQWRAISSTCYAAKPDALLFPYPSNLIPNSTCD